MLTAVACLKFVRAQLLDGNRQSSGYALNPYDLYMLEQLLELKNTISCRIIGVAMAPEACLEPMRKCMAMGLDDIHLVSDPCFAGADTFSTSYILYRALEYIGQADIYAFGEKSVDGETSQVPIGVASHLDLLCYTGVKRIDECMKIPYPFAVSFSGFTTVQPDISLLKLKRFKDYKVTVLDASSIQLDKQYCGQGGSKTKVIQTVNVVNKRQSKLIEGTISDKVNALDLILKEGFQ